MKNEVSSSSSSSSPHRSVVVFNKKTNVHIKWIFCMLIKNLKLHFPWCTEQPTNPADRIWGGGASGQKLQQNVLTRSFRVCFYSAGGSAGPARPSLAQVQGQRGCPSRPALAARASFCWMWYSWKRMEILWVIFRYFCRHDSEQLDWNTNSCEDFIQMFLHSHVSVIQSSFFTSSGFTSLVVKSRTQSMKQFSVTLLYVPRNSLNWTQETDTAQKTAAEQQLSKTIWETTEKDPRFRSGKKFPQTGFNLRPLAASGTLSFTDAVNSFGFLQSAPRLWSCSKEPRWELKCINSDLRVRQRLPAAG